MAAANAPVPSDGPAPDTTTAARDTFVEQAFDGSNLVALRSTVAAHASEGGVADDRLDDLVLVAHELAINAVRHGGGAGVMRLWRQDGRFFCRVTDSGAGMAGPDSAGRFRPDPHTPGGRGLWLVRQLSAHVHVRTSGRGTVVTVVFDP